MLQLRHPHLPSKLSLSLPYCALLLVFEADQPTTLCIPKTSAVTEKRATMLGMSELKNQIERLQGRVHETMVRL
jgi:hypothetical protein